MSKKNENEAEKPSITRDFLPSDGASCCASSRIEAMKAAQKFHLLANHPHLQAEAIADHYSKLAAVAMDLRMMVELRRRSGGSPEMDRCIERLTHEFIGHHREDFGIELSWHNV